MRVLVCGGRDFSDLSSPRNTPDRDARKREYIFLSNYINDLCWSKGLCTLESERDEYGNWMPEGLHIIAGAAKGADTSAVNWAQNSWVPYTEYPADWTKYGKEAGYIRNKQMLDEGKPDLVVAFPGGKETAMMVKLAKDAGVEVIEVAYP